MSMMSRPGCGSTVLERSCRHNVGGSETHAVAEVDKDRLTVCAEFELEGLV